MAFATAAGAFPPPRARAHACRARPRRVSAAPPRASIAERGGARARGVGAARELARVRSRPVPGLDGWAYAGPALDGRALPAVVYFALTAEQSLTAAPFNEPVRYLLCGGDAAAAVQPRATESDEDAGLRVFSVSLPCHGGMRENEAALAEWAARYAEGKDVVSWFTRRAVEGLDVLLREGHVAEGAVYAAGLSRGALLAAHLARAHGAVDAVLAFSPVTDLGVLREFAGLADAVQADPSLPAARAMGRASLFADGAVEGLCGKAVRVYSGNMDTRVGTRRAFEWMATLADRAAEKNVRSPPHEYIMFCSLGRDGHGTSSDVFCVGARWLLRRAGLRE